MLCLGVAPVKKRSEKLQFGMTRPFVAPISANREVFLLAAGMCVSNFKAAKSSQGDESSGLDRHVLGGFVKSMIVRKSRRARAEPEPP